MKQQDAILEDGASRYQTSSTLVRRAHRVIPNGVWGHNKFPAIYGTDAYPWFARSGRGCHFFDVDGNEFIDFICGYGAMINGYAHPDIDDAAKAAMDRGDCFAQTTEISIELAETLTKQIAGMSWCAYGKSGSDSLATAILVARAATGRKRLICFSMAYHGSHFWSNWSNPGSGRPLSDSADVIQIPWNSISSFETALKEHPNEVCALVATPFHHPIPGPSVLPEPGFWSHVSELCRAHEVLIIVDDVRTGFRIALSGSHSHYHFDADIVCLSKALGNTHPISATLGRHSLFESACGVFSAGTFWGASAPMAASLANLRILRNSDAVERMNRLGTLLWNGLVSNGASHGFSVLMSGVSAIPSMNIEGDDEAIFVRRFAEEMVAKGIFINPLHNWFLSNAHTEADIEQALDGANHAFKAVKRAVGTP